jgi:hypothetical protein
MFTTNDIWNGRPALFRTYVNYGRGRLWLGMYQDERGDHQLTRTMVDSLTFWGSVKTQSAGGDIDGDGVDECVWTTPESVRAYKAFGDNDLRKVWELQLDPGPVNVNTWTTTIYDVNGDGHNEWMLACDSISIFEVDAVDLLSPNGGSCSVGDTVPILWAVNTPPRCDSLSLFLRRDSLWNLDTIVTGLPGTDTLYRWVVPSGVPDTGRVVVIAYGPSPQPSPNGSGSEGEGLPKLGQVAWQFDMSDSVIHFTGSGVAERTRRVPQQWSLSVSPNPARGAFTVRYDVPGLGAKAGTVPRSAGTRGTVPVFALGIYDAGGRLVRSLLDGALAPGRYEARLSSGVLPAGVYFLHLDAPGFRDVKKAVVAK